MIIIMNYNCNNDKILEIINKMSYIVKYTLPFKQFYSNIEVYENRNYQINKLKYKKNKLFEINNIDQYSKYRDIPSKISNEIPIYKREKKELKEMLNEDYYNKFYYDNIITYKYNPTLNTSYIYNKYVITPTIMPVTEDHLVFIIYNKDKNIKISAYDFYDDTNKFLIYEMYEIYSSLSKNNNKYILINSLEAGSLPEIYHFHIQKNTFNLSFIDTNNKYYIDINNYIKHNDYLYEINEHKQFSNIYLINLSIKKEILYLIPELIFKLRLYNNEQYMAQLFFLTIDKQIYLCISFKKVKIQLKQIDKMTGNYIQEYYDELFGDLYNKYKIIYYPFGLIIYQDEDNIQITNEIENKMKSKYHKHNNFINIFNNIILKEKNYNYNNNNNIGNSIYFKDILKKTINKNFDKYVDIIDINRKLSIIYNLENIEILNNIYTNGRVDFNGDEYYYLSGNNIDIKYYNNLLNSNDYYDIFLYYYCLLKYQNINYYIFEPIKTTLDKFLEYDINNLFNDPNLINYFIFKVYYIIYTLSKINKYISNINITDCYITDNIHIITEYFFDNYNIIAINKNNDNNNYKLHHYNHNLKIKFINLINTNNNNNYLESFRSFIISLYNKCNELKILNRQRYNDIEEGYNKFSFLQNLYDHINNNNNDSFFDYIKWFKFSNNYYSYKTGFYNAVKEISNILNININDDIQKYYRVIEHISLNKDSKMQYIIDNYDIINYDQINNDNIILSCIGNNVDKQDIYTLPEIKNKTDLEMTYFSHITDFKNIINLNIALNVYGKNNNTTRYDIFRIKKNVSLIDFSPNNISLKNIEIKNKLLDLLSNILNINFYILKNKYNSNNIDIIEKIQLLLNFSLRYILDSTNNIYNIIGTTSILLVDNNIREIAIIKPSLYTELLGCFVIHENNILFFTNFSFFYNYIYNIDIILQDLNNQVKNIILNYSNIESFINFLSNSNYNFYNRPLFYEEYNFIIDNNSDNKIDNFIKQINYDQNGGLKNYSYKINKYIDKLSLLTNISSSKKNYYDYNHYILYKDKYLVLKNLYNN